MTTLKAGLRSTELTDPILNRTVDCGDLVIEAAGAKPYVQTFRHMARDLAYDISEVPVVAIPMAVDAGQPLSALPIVLVGGEVMHAAIACKDDSPINNPSDLEGRRIGIRSHSQTTTVWARGILKDQYGVDLTTLRWTATEPSYIPGFDDPPSVTIDEGRDLVDLLETGDVDAIIMAPWSLRKVPGVRPVIADAEDAAARWRHAHGVYCVSHVLCIRQDLVGRDPDLASTLCRAFAAARAQLDPSGDAAHTTGPFGRRANEASINLLFRYAHEQGLTRKPYSYDDVFLPSGVD